MLACSLHEKRLEVVESAGRWEEEEEETAETTTSLSRETRVADLTTILWSVQYTRSCPSYSMRGCSEPTAAHFSPTLYGFSTWTPESKSRSSAVMISCQSRPAHRSTPPSPIWQTHTRCHSSLSLLGWKQLISKWCFLKPVRDFLSIQSIILSFFFWFLFLEIPKLEG